MRAKKIYCVVAYDIADNKRRRHFIKLIKPYGVRINYSVFECMFTATQLKKLEYKIDRIIDSEKDQIAIYPICVDCYMRTRYIPEKNITPQVVHIY